MINKVQKYVALMVSLLILTGCQNRKGQDDINTMHKTGEELRFYNQVSPMCETDDGIYYLDNDEFINYYDFASGQSMIVCNKPNCKHEKWNSKTPDEQRCNAYEELRIQGIFEEDSKLYVTTYYPEEGNTILVGSDLDRSNKKVVCTIEMDYCKQIALYKGMLYMATNKAIYEITEEGLPEMTGDSYTWLYGINLKSGKVDELTERQSGHNSELSLQIKSQAPNRT